MSSEAILENPALFANLTPDLDDIAIEYIDFALKFGANLYQARSHLVKFHFDYLTKNQGRFGRLFKIKNFEDLKKFSLEIKAHNKDIPSKEKKTWYLRKHSKTYETFIE